MGSGPTPEVPPVTMATWPVISAARGVLCCVAFHHIIAPRTAAPPNRTTLKGDTLQASLMQAVTRRLIARQRQTQASREPSCRCALCCGGLGLTFAQKWSPCKCVGRPGPCSATVCFRSAICDCLSRNGCFSLWACTLSKRVGLGSRPLL